MKARWTSTARGWRAGVAVVLLGCVGPALGDLDYRDYGGNASGGGSHSENLFTTGWFTANTSCGTGVQQLAVSWVYGGRMLYSTSAQQVTVRINMNVSSGYAKWSSWSYAGQAALWGKLCGRVQEWNGSTWVKVRESWTTFVEKPWWQPVGYTELNGSPKASRSFTITLKANTWYAFDGKVELRSGTQGIALSEIKISSGTLNVSW
ncbi:MAG: hypothetical protein AB1716_15735 [Planctomycetota bacterium]